MITVTINLKQAALAASGNKFGPILTAPDKDVSVTIDESKSPVAIGNQVWAAFANYPRHARVVFSRAALASAGISHAKLPATS